MLKKRVLIFFFLFITSYHLSAQTGNVLRGVVKDKSTKEQLIGAIVTINEDITLSTATDIDGTFVIENIPTGKQKISVKYISYKSIENQDIEIKEGENEWNADLESNTNEIKEVEITATMKKESISSLLKIQKNTLTIGDGISSESIRKSPDRTTADALKRVTGISLIQNKFAIIRGLSDRYNSVLLNGLTVPSTEADRRVFALDLFPANLLDNLIILKTATAEMPSDFAGGIIQLNTKEIPESNSWLFSIGTTYNSLATFQKHDYATRYSSDILGLGQSQHDFIKSLPDAVDFKNLSKTEKLIQTRDMQGTWGLNNSSTTMPNTSLQIVKTYGRDLGEKQKWGLVAGLTYNNSNSIQSAQRHDYDASNEALFDYTDVLFTNNILWGAMLNTGFKTKHNKYNLHTSFTTNTDMTTTRREGINYELLQKEWYYINDYKANQLLDIAFAGENEILDNIFKIKYNLGYDLFKNQIPSLQRLYYYQNLNDPEDLTPSAYVPVGSPDPNRSGILHSDLSENRYAGNTVLEYSFKWHDEKQKIKLGYNGLLRERTFDARALGMRIYDVASFDWSILDQGPSTIFSSENIGTNGFYLDEITNNSDHYEASITNHAFFLLTENNFKEKLKWNAGVRCESYNQKLSSYNFSNQKVDIDQTSLTLLPSANIVYEVLKNMNLRFSASQTTARPEFRELAPFSFYDFSISSTIVGNQNLVSSHIYNYDLRYEFYPTNTELLSASLFYKDFMDPIEQTAYSTGAGSRIRSFENVSKAQNLGVEIELRKNLKFLETPLHLHNLKRINLLLNATYIQSKVDLSSVASAVTKTRALQGQSPMIINAGISYDDTDHDFSMSILYNYISDRIIEVGTQGYLDVFEKNRNIMDFTISKAFKNHHEFKMTFKDLLQNKMIYYQDVDNNHQYSVTSDNLIQHITMPIQIGISYRYKF